MTAHYETPEIRTRAAQENTVEARQALYYARQTDLRLALHGLIDRVDSHGIVAAGGRYTWDYLGDLAHWLETVRRIHLR